jgi:hypothetical protein
MEAITVGGALVLIGGIYLWASEYDFSAFMSRLKRIEVVAKVSVRVKPVVKSDRYYNMFKYTR